jgi:hypothetical protein
MNKLSNEGRRIRVSEGVREDGEQGVLIKV